MKRKVAEKASKPAKKGKAGKDPNMPKRPPSAFFVSMSAKLPKRSGNLCQLRRRLHMKPLQPKRKAEYNKTMVTHNKKQNTSLGKMADEKVETRITLKLLVDTRKKRVLFAEAGKDFVDFIFSLLTLPVGSVIKLLSPPSMVGCIGKLYQSIDKLNETYILPSRDKGVYLQPKINASDGVDTLLSICGSTSSMGEAKYYRCGNCGSYMTTVSGTMCPSCNRAMSTGMKLVMPAVTPAGEVGGFVKGVVTYMVTDDLEVTPMSAISSITLINKFVKKDEVELEEMEVPLGMKEGLALLEASLMSKTALSDAFFGKASASSSSSASKSSV